MTTSGTTSFTMSTTKCVRMAFEEIGVVGEGNDPSPYDYGVGKDRLNALLKDWQNFGDHLWVRQKTILFLQKGQTTYTISATSNDHVASSTPVSTTLSANAALGATTITVTSSTGFVSSEYIGIQLDNGTMFWSTVNTVLSPTSIQINDALTSAASSGKYVFGYVTNLTNVFNATYATRRLITSGIDTPLIWQSYNDYLRMPNKLSLGTPNMWSYDRQRDQFLINIWMCPQDVSYYINLNVDRKIQDVNVGSDEFDIPQEWNRAAYLNLAVDLAPAYGKAQGENFACTVAKAKEALERALGVDNELGSIQIVPARNNIRGNN